MRKKFIWLAIFLMCSGRLFSQISPIEGEELNYRIVGFTFPENEAKGRYMLEIAAGFITNMKAFDEHIIKTKNSEVNKIIAEVPAFGATYTWRVSKGRRKASWTNAELHHFSTGYVPWVDTSLNRLRVLKPGGEREAAYVFVDYSGVLYDTKGNPVWYLPRDTIVEDLKMSEAGTVTFLSEGSAWEVNYDGNVLWSKMRDTISEPPTNFHHDFTRMDNGHYMVLESRYRLKKAARYKDSVARNRMDSNMYFNKVVYDVLNEYDEWGREVWQWNSADYFFNSDLAPIANNEAPDDNDLLHINSFYFDKEHRNIYLSCRNVSRIIKISYPDGEVLANYGKKYTGNFVHGSVGATSMINELFAGQHSCRRSDDGYLYLYNNNLQERRGKQEMPEVVKLREPVNGGDELGEVWTYKCTVDSGYTVETGRRAFSRGGNVELLNVEDVFVSMSGPYSKLFVLRNGDSVLWSALPETRGSATGKWMPATTYRASMISSSSLHEHLVFGGG